MEVLTGYGSSMAFFCGAGLAVSRDLTGFEEGNEVNIHFERIGMIHTPYTSMSAPEQSQRDAPGEFWISLNPEYAAGLDRLEKFRYIYLLYFLDQVRSAREMAVTPPWAGGIQVGLFASRSPNRPNPIGLSVVEIKEIDGRDIVTTGVDCFNGTPLLDIKPYIRTLDFKEDANDGWFNDLEDRSHLVDHLLGIAHEHER